MPKKSEPQTAPVVTPPARPFDDLTCPVWVEKQRLRRIYQGLMIHQATRSEFLLNWSMYELMRIVRDE